ncbi:MAG: 4Fe-4S binding protein [Candidatus Hydrogenedentes bacterium]|nr:4Fe-4S binding protein [Candidatus Hydrogenedentota bacterium]
MKESASIPLVTTIRERCRTCYTCVRECPAKAIRIVDGQADVISQRCIGCGNCVQVCGQHAKRVYDSTEAVKQLLNDGGRVAAIIAPSFPGEFVDWNFRLLAGVLRRMGFHYVIEVAAGADLVADRYRQLMERKDGRCYIATTCPAVVAYVERYFPKLVDSLAPIVSPMVATARAVRRMYGDNVKVVFVGPCIAKKGEAASSQVRDEIDAVLTFVELRQMAWELDLSRHTVQESEFDPPLAGPGSLFPLHRGMLQAANLPEDLVHGDVVTAGGRSGFVEAVKEFHLGHCSPHLLEVLACEGCIMGPGTSNKDPLFRRRRRVSSYVRARLEHLDWDAWRRQMAEFADLDLSRVFEQDDQRIPDPTYDEIKHILHRMGKHSVEDELNCGACGYETCHEHATAIYKGLAESEMCLPYTIDKLRQAVSSLAVSNEKLARARETLVQAEKLATMGQLAAGIAHELNNPLGVVLMYAHMLLEDCQRNPQMREDLDMLATQADRCKKIVAGLLHFARQNKVALEATDIRALLDTCLRLVTVPKNITAQVFHEGEDTTAEIDRDQVTQVLTNLINNACHAMPGGGMLTLRTRGEPDEVFFIIEDTGTGIAKENISKIFDPFFTTKPIGEGTGMGLAVSYGIVKMHRGNIRVTSNADPAAGPTGTTFTVSLPRKGQVTPAADGEALAEEQIGAPT